MRQPYTAATIAKGSARGSAEPVQSRSSSSPPGICLLYCRISLLSTVPVVQNIRSRTSRTGDVTKGRERKRGAKKKRPKTRTRQGDELEGRASTAREWGQMTRPCSMLGGIPRHFGVLPCACPGRPVLCCPGPPLALYGPARAAVCRPAPQRLPRAACKRLRCAVLGAQPAVHPTMHCASPAPHHRSPARERRQAALAPGESAAARSPCLRASPALAVLLRPGDS